MVCYLFQLIEMENLQCTRQPTMSTLQRRCMIIVRALIFIIFTIRFSIGILSKYESLLIGDIINLTVQFYSLQLIVYSNRLQKKFIQSTRYQMFKKAIKIGAQNQLSGKDKKTIKSKMSEIFDGEAVECLFSKNDKIVSAKVTGSKMLIYTGEEYPIIVDGTGKNDYFPTVYACEAFEPLIKYIVLNEGVQTFIFNGANLMWPGVSSFQGLGKFKKDDVIGIKNAKGQVIAIGALGCSLEELQSSDDKSGIAAYILHYKNDKLYELGPKTQVQCLMKAGKAKEPIKQQKKVEKKIQQKSQPIQQKSQPKKQEKANKKEEKKTKQKQPSPQKQQSQSDESDGQANFMGLLHNRGSRQPIVNVQPKKKVAFQDSDEDKGGKKKGGKKGKNKGGAKNEDVMMEQQIIEKPKKNKKTKGKQQSQEEQVVEKEKENEKEKEKEKEKPKNNKKVKGKQQSQEEQVIEKEKEKGKNSKKNKGKHQSQEEQEIVEKQKPKNKKSKVKQQSQEEEEIVQKQPGNKKKGKKDKQQQKVERKKSEDQPENASEKGSDGQVVEISKKEEVSSISTKIMDDSFKQCFLNVLKLSKVQAELPIDSGRFYMDYMLLARPEGVKLEIKESSYKKIGKFYQEMAKKKFIEFKHGKDKKGQQGSKITAIFYDNQEFKNFVPTIKRMGQKDVQVKQEVTNMKAAKLKISKTLVVQNVYKCSEDLLNVLNHKKVDFLKDIDEDDQKKDEKKPQYFSQADLKAKMHKYIENICDNKAQNKKDKKTQKMVVIDYKKNPYIAMLLQKEISEHQENMAEQEANAPAHDSNDQEAEKKNKNKKKSNTFRIDRDFLVNKMMKKTTAFHHILDKQHQFESFRQGQFKGVQIFAEKANNKNITRIIGLEIFIVPKEEIDRQIHSLSQMFQQKYACSVNVLNLPGKNAGKQLILHGTFLDQLQEFFVQQGVSKNHVTLVNKLDKKKKK